MEVVVEEDDEPKKAYVFEDYGDNRVETFEQLPEWLLSVDSNSNGVSDILDFPDPSLGENVLYYFYEDEGGPSIATVSDLQIAMLAMFYHRLDIGLETKTVFIEIPEPLEFRGCSRNT